jgi:hypothetical protein
VAEREIPGHERVHPLTVNFIFLWNKFFAGTFLNISGKGWAAIKFKKLEKS